MPVSIVIRIKHRQLVCCIVKGDFSWDFHCCACHWKSGAIFFAASREEVHSSRNYLFHISYFVTTALFLGHNVPNLAQECTVELFFSWEVGPKTYFLRLKNLELKFPLLFVVFALNFYLVPLLFNEAVVIFEVEVDLFLETLSKLFEQWVKRSVINSWYFGSTHAVFSSGRLGRLWRVHQSCLFLRNWVAHLLNNL